MKFSATDQRGISLVITFLLMTIMLAIVVSLSTIVFNEVKISSVIGNSMTAFYSAESGLEKTIYASARHGGLCNMCAVCDANSCAGCTVTLVGVGGCQVEYSGSSGSATYHVRASAGGASVQGYYKDASRTIAVGAIK